MAAALLAAGNSESKSGYRFNLSLMVTGLVLTVLANCLGRDFEFGMRMRGHEPARLVRLLSWLFACVGVMLAIVGLVPDAVNFAVHVGSASGMVVLFVRMATVYGGGRFSGNRRAEAGRADVSSSGFEGGSGARLEA